MREKNKRSVIKAFSWRLIATLTTMTLVFLFTGKIDLAFEIGAFEVSAKMMLYFFHERAWNSIKWGRVRI